MNDLNRAVFLDRDGVINQKASEGEYVTLWEDFRFLPGVAEGIASLNHAGFHVIVVTNQRCVAKGLIGESQLRKLHERMVVELEAKGAALEAVFYCPHDLDASCDCRKPQPGMLTTAARTLNIDLGSSWIIGDSESDIEAGRRAGCKTVLMAGEASTKSATIQADLVAANFLEAVQHMLNRESAGPAPDSPALQKNNR